MLDATVSAHPASDKRAASSFARLESIVKKQSLFSPIELLIILIILLWLLISAYPSYEAYIKETNMAVVEAHFEAGARYVEEELRRLRAEQPEAACCAFPNASELRAALNADGARAPGGGAAYAEMADRELGTVGLTEEKIGGDAAYLLTRPAYEDFSERAYRRISTVGP